MASVATWSVSRADNMNRGEQLSKPYIRMTLTVVATAMSVAVIGPIATPIAAYAATSTGTQGSEIYVLTSGGQSQTSADS